MVRESIESIDSSESVSISMSSKTPPRRLDVRNEVGFEAGGVSAGVSGGELKGELIGEVYAEPGAEHAGEAQGMPSCLRASPEGKRYFDSALRCPQEA